MAIGTETLAFLFSQTRTREERRRLVEELAAMGEHASAFEAFAARVIDGEDPDEAARAAGGTGRPGAVPPCFRPRKGARVRVRMEPGGLSYPGTLTGRSDGSFVWVELDDPELAPWVGPVSLVEVLS